jgi:hypothetical protein
MSHEEFYFWFVSFLLLNVLAVTLSSSKIILYGLFTLSKFVCKNISDIVMFYCLPCLPWPRDWNRNYLICAVPPNVVKASSEVTVATAVTVAVTVAVAVAVAITVAVAVTIAVAVAGIITLSFANRNMALDFKDFQLDPRFKIPKQFTAIPQNCTTNFDLFLFDNIGYTNTMVLYCHSMVITRVILL